MPRPQYYWVDHERAGYGGTWRIRGSFAKHADVAAYASGFDARIEQCEKTIKELEAKLAAEKANLRKVKAEKVDFQYENQKAKASGGKVFITAEIEEPEGEQAAEAAERSSDHDADYGFTLVSDEQGASSSAAAADSGS